MAMNSSYSMNANLAEGATDGSYKKVVRDRGGNIDAVTYAERADLDDGWYGIHEKGMKNLGDGTAHKTPDYYGTPDPRWPW